MASVAALAAWDEPSTSASGAKRYQTLSDVCALTLLQLILADEGPFITAGTIPSKILPAASGHDQ